jgi:DNA-binding NarL/FixJ family response regulator
LREGAELSNREGHVLALISKGMTNRDIAAFLVLSEETIKMGTSNISRKLGARNRTHAVDSAAFRSSSQKLSSGVL